MELQHITYLNLSHPLVGVVHPTPAAQCLPFSEKNVTFNLCESYCGVCFVICVRVSLVIADILSSEKIFFCICLRFLEKRERGRESGENKTIKKIDR